MIRPRGVQPILGRGITGREVFFWRVLRAVNQIGRGRERGHSPLLFPTEKFKVFVLEKAFVVLSGEIAHSR